MRNFIYLCCAFLIWCGSPASAALPTSQKENIDIVIQKNAHQRIQFGARKVAEALNEAGYKTKIQHQNHFQSRANTILIAEKNTPQGANLLKLEGSGNNSLNHKEGFLLNSHQNNKAVIVGADATGALYGCLELIEQIAGSSKLPQSLSLSDHPEMVLRGTSIGMQKPTELPGRGMYEYPYTPEDFPWFYDKSLWIKYLDMMVENRYNSLYLWNGHPFSSLVKVKEYPYALEVSEETFKKNEEVFRFLTEEADKRGIWVIQMFYNIIIPKPFAEKHGLATQDRNRPIIPIIADYTRKSIAAFVEKYPNVGLLVTLGEAMEGTGQDDVDWFTETIIPGVKDGLRALKTDMQPPIVLRAHDTDAPRVMKESLPIYKNLYTMAKFNGEALTTYTPRGSWAELHRRLSRIGTVHVQNVHILANLEPFRYGSADFIQKSVQAMHDIYESNAIHIYPQASYWDWPYAADKAKDRLYQVDRDAIWYKAWARYAWNSRRDRNNEVSYWSGQLGNTFGAGQKAGENILKAYEETGEIAPKLLRRYGITDGNRQTLTLGMTMTQLINPFRYNLFTMLYESEAPEGEMIIEYAEKDWNKQAHIGETPVRVADEVLVHGRKAIEAIDAASQSVTLNKDEFARLRNDVYSYNELAAFYSAKVQAALSVLRYKYSEDIADLERALPLLEKSVVHYRKLADLTKDTYLYANSLQTKHRKIPMRGVDATYKHWVEVLPVYEKELAHFRRSIDSMKNPAAAQGTARLTVYRNAPVKLLNSRLKFFTVQKGAKIYADTSLQIQEFAPEIAGLKGVQLSKKDQVKNGTAIEFSTSRPVKVLVGFYNEKRPGLLGPPDLEHDVSANDFGQSEIKIANALLAGTYAPVNVHSYSFPVGKHTLKLAKGACVILGFVDAGDRVRLYDAGIGVKGNKKDIDWLFE
ncbi:MAG: alpha-d-galacturonidase [Arcticibacter sp.]